MVVDAGFGNIEVEVDDDPDIFKRVKKGDLVRIRTGRLDLHEVMD